MSNLIRSLSVYSSKVTPLETQRSKSVQLPPKIKKSIVKAVKEYKNLSSCKSCSCRKKRKRRSDRSENNAENVEPPKTPILSHRQITNVRTSGQAASQERKPLNNDKSDKTLIQKRKLARSHTFSHGIDPFFTLDRNPCNNRLSGKSAGISRSKSFHHKKLCQTKSTPVMREQKVLVQQRSCPDRTSPDQNFTDKSQMTDSGHETKSKCTTGTSSESFHYTTCLLNQSKADSLNSANILKTKMRSAKSKRKGKERVESNLTLVSRDLQLVHQTLSSKSKASKRASWLSRKSGLYANVDELNDHLITKTPIPAPRTTFFERRSNGMLGDCWKLIENEVTPVPALRGYINDRVSDSSNLARTLTKSKEILMATSSYEPFKISEDEEPTIDFLDSRSSSNSILDVDMEHRIRGRSGRTYFCTTKIWGI